MKTTTWMAVAALLAVVGCGQKETQVAQQEGKPAEQTPAAQQQAPQQQSATVAGIPKVSGDTVTTPSGLKYVDITVGTGATPQAGQLVSVHYTGWFPDGKPFDSSRERGQPYTFPIGMRRVIQGWDEGIMSMKMGGRRLLIVPPAMAYGERGYAPVIPPNATLVFDAELVNVQTAPQ